MLHSDAASSSATGCASLAQTKTADCGTLAANESKLGPNWPTNRGGYSAKVATVVVANDVVVAVEVEAGSRRQTAGALRLAH